MTDALITELEETIAQAETYDVSTITLPLHEMKILMQMATQNNTAENND